MADKKTDRSSENKSSGSISSAQAKQVQAQLKALRQKVLDLSRRNRLLNFKHSPKGRDHIRIIDEVLSGVFDTLRNGKGLSFQALPDPDPQFLAPKDEGTDVFQAYLREARQSDDYQRKLERVHQKHEDDEDEVLEAALNRLERDTRDVIRQELGMVSIRKQPNQTNAQWARQHGVDPSFTLLDNQGSKPEHHDTKLQTLLLPSELDAKLKAIVQQQNQSINETGINTLFMVFGFLEWSEADSSDETSLAPLILLPISISKEINRGNIIYKLEPLGDDPAFNETLRVRMLKENISFPDFSPDCSILTFFEQITEAIATKRAWKVRNYATIGHFAFHRLAIYEDFDSERWPEGAKPHQHQIVRQLLGGRETAESVSYREVYNPDDAEYEIDSPELVRDADSSQFSAIVDVLRGENLVIQGPPGTGKSQTIANMIAAAMGKGKTVLFVSEKLSALEVVKKRLDDDLLGSCCLELHSAKATKTAILEKLKERLDYRRPKLNAKDNREDLKQAKELLKEYLELLQKPIRRTGASVEDALWMSRRKDYTSLPEDLQRFRFSAIESQTKTSLRSIRERLQQLVEAEASLSVIPALNAWRFVRRPHLTVVERSDILKVLNELKGVADEIAQHLLDLRTSVRWQFPQDVENLKRLCKAVKSLPSMASDDAKRGYNALAQQKCWDAYLAWVGCREVISSLNVELSRSLKHFDSNALSLLEEINDVIAQCKSAGIRFNRVQDLDSVAKQKSDLLGKTDISWRKARDCFDALGVAIDNLKPADLAFLVAVDDLLRSVPEILFDERKEYLTEAGILSEIQGLRATLVDHDRRIREQCEQLEMEDSFVPSRRIRLHRTALAKAGLFRFFSSDYQTAKVFADSLYYNEKKRTRAEIVDDLIALEEVVCRKEEFLASEAFSRLLHGDSRGAEEYLDVATEIASFFEQVRSRFSVKNNQFEGLLRMLKSADRNTVDILREKLSAACQLIPELNQQMAECNAGDEHELRTGYRDEIEILEASFSRLTEMVGVDPLISWDGLEELAEKLACLIKQLQASDGLAATLSEFVDGRDFEAFLTDLEMGYPFVSAVRSLDFDEALSTVLLSEDGVQIYDLLRQASGWIEGKLKLLTGCFDRLSALAGADVSSWFAGDFTTVLAYVRVLQDKSDGLEPWSEWITAFSLLQDSGGGELQLLIDKHFKAEVLLENLDVLIGLSLCDYVMERHPRLKALNGLALDDAKKKIRKIDSDLKLLAKESVLKTLEEKSKGAPLGNGVGGKLEWTQMHLLRNLAGLTRMHPKMNTRRMIRQAGGALQALMPCFMMSPLSVAQFIEPGGIKFDLVIFDEASQVLPEDAIGALLRGHQFVVVGDAMQLPPSTQFSVGTQELDAEIGTEDENESVEIEESILEKAQTMFYPPRRLLWHYRSKHPSLIAFSNKEFYDEQLQIFPSPYEEHPLMGIKYRYVGGTYVGRSNPEEADAIVDAVIAFMKEHPKKSLGIVALNAIQRDLIEHKLDHAISKSSDAMDYRRRSMNSLEPLFVKNLETVQGDERDVIFISTVFGPAPKTDKVLQRFGPINTSVGHRRLNVLFTRAKESTRLFTSLKPEDIIVDEMAPWGRRALREYLEYARSGRLHVGRESRREPDSEFEVQVRDKLRAQGYDCECQVGVSGYFIDLAVKHPRAQNHYILGVECDGARYHSFKSARDRDRLRQDVLESLGWKIHRIWSTDWFRDSEKQTQILIDTIRRLQATIDPIIVFNSDTVEDEVFSDEIDSAEEVPEIEQLLPTVEVGDTVTYVFWDLPDYEETVTIVSTRSIPEEGIINAETLIAKSLLGRSQGDTVEVLLPKAKRHLEIREILKCSMGY